jgi:uncharacterized protein YjlB
VARASGVHELALDVVLRGLGTVSNLADVHEARAWSAARQHTIAHEMVVVDLGRAREEVGGAKGQQSWVSGTRADEVHGPGRGPR